MPVRRPPLWALALLATLVVRTTVAASRMEELELERYTGNLAWSLLHGVSLDPEMLPIIPHLRGSFVFGVLAVPFVALLGPGLLALKALAVLFGALGAALFTALVERGLGRRAAWLSVGWFAAAPPSMQMVDVLALGSHADTLPFLIAPLVVLFGARGDGPLGPGRTAALGVLFGAGLFFSMQLWVAAPALLGAWLVLDPRGWRSRRALLFAAGAAPSIALIPLVTRSATLVNRSIESRFLPDGLGGALDRLRGMLGGDLTRSWLFLEHGGAVLGWVLTAVIVLGVAAAVWSLLRPLGDGQGQPRRRQALAVFACLHVAGLAGAYAISDFELNLRATEDGMGSRYFMPLWPAFGLFACFALERASALPSRALAAVLAAMALLPGLIGAASLVDTSRLGQQPPPTALELYLFQHHLQHEAGESPEALLALVERLDPDWPTMRPWMYSVHFPDLLNSSKASFPERIAALAAPPLDELARLRAVHMGTQLMESLLRARKSSGDAVSTVRGNLMQAAQRLPPELAPWLLRGAGMAATARQLEEARLEIKRSPELAGELRFTEPFHFVALLPAALRPAYLEGMGFRLGLRTGPYEAIDHPVYRSLDALPAEQLAIYLKAAGWGYRMRYLEASYRPPGDLLIHQRLSPEHRPLFDAGLHGELPRQN